MLRILALAISFLCLVTTARAADASALLGPWNSVDNAGLRDLSAGKIATAFNSSMTLPRGMSCQAVFLVNATPDATHRALLNFNSVRHPELEVFQHHVFHDEKDASFDKLQLNPRHPAGAALIRSMSDPGEIQLAKGEIPLLPRARGAEPAQLFLTGLLRDRWTRFARGGDFGAAAAHDAAGEIRSLLAEEGKMSAHFETLLAPLRAKGAPGTPRFFYWDQSVVDKRAAVQLGVVYSSESPERRQLLDLTYYSTCGYLVSVTVYELLPVTLAGRPQTLVWQGNLVSTTGIEGGLGLKRKIGARMMVSDVEKWIRIFRDDAQKGGG